MSSLYAIHCFYIGDNTHEISFDIKGTMPSYAIYSYDHEKKMKGQLLLESHHIKDQFICELSETKRQYFLFESHGEVLVFSHRIIPLDGMYNVRDMGGYLCKDGKRTKWGHIYRGDHLINLKEASFTKFLSLDVDTIIDLRSSEEINSHPNPYLNQDQTVYCDPNAHTAAFAGILQDLDGKDDHVLLQGSMYTKKQAITQMESQQKRFVYEPESKLAFARMLRTIGSSETTISYQHCRGGKDRTGYSIMLIQEILGIYPHLIIDDYMLTKRARAKKNKQYKERFLKLAHNNQDVADYLYMHFDTRESFIVAAQNEISEHYESVLDYIKTELKISDRMLDLIREKYLE
ncbi:tyrosine-protein phosphatase [Erysipelothrix urinaevulpis]|uniref:tyrosine-protein phosphatase n=1 Tax=Erysipelothrix urinaevulpis TaxID=2683717 RepID=UPI00135CD020|nr:tyrosine-protein phosphatase [Erysipelothrix urinaevulpis]